MYRRGLHFSPQLMQTFFGEESQDRPRCVETQDVLLFRMNILPHRNVGKEENALKSDADCEFSHASQTHVFTDFIRIPTKEKKKN
jgi:hypothetical protein